MSSKLELDVRHCIYRWRHLVKATEVTTGLAESNGSLPLNGWFNHLQAVLRNQLWAQLSISSMGKL